MKFANFVKEKSIYIILVIFSLITIEILFLIYDFKFFIKLYTPIIILLSLFIGIIAEYIKKKDFYNKLLFELDKLDQKYLISEIVNTPNFLEGRILKTVIDETDKSMLENVNLYKHLQQDYKEYIELWIHEIKLPISTSKLIIENNTNSVTQSIDEELDKIDNYIEQALFYARSNTVEKDYIIKRVNLTNIVNEVVKKNKNILIQKDVKIKIENVDMEVYTDSKWCLFILNQIVQNSINYFDKEEKVLEFSCIERKEAVELTITDNGMGINKEEVGRVFEKGFTGTNGRNKNKKSTGIGLYLCKKLCIKLNLDIKIKSNKPEGTQVLIVFPKGSYNII